MIKLSVKSVPDNQRFWLLLAGNFVVLGLVGFFVLRPVLGLLVSHTNQIVATRQQIAASQQKIADLQNLKVTLPELTATYAPLANSLPPTKDMAGYQAELEALAAVTSVQLITVNSAGAVDNSKSANTTNAANAQPTQVGGLPATPVKIDVAGPFANVLDFMHRLETMNRFTRVTGFDIKANESTGSIRAAIQLQVLYQPAGGTS